MMNLKNINSITSDHLLWRQPKFGTDHFQLLAGDDELAEVYWTELFSDKAIAQTSSASWIFDRVGFFRHRIRVEDAATGVETARIELGCWDSGEIALPNGAEFAWQKVGFWGDTWVFTRKNGRKLFDLWFGLHWFKRTGEVLLAAEARSEPALPLLLCLGWYLATCDTQDAGAAAAAGGSVAAIT